MNKYFFLILVVALAQSQLLFAQTTVEVSAATRKALGIETEIVQSSNRYTGATSSGMVLAPPAQRMNILSPFDSVMVQPLVMPGMQVKAGQKVAVLQSAEFALALAELETQKLTVIHDQHLFDNAKQLNKLGLNSAQELDEAEHTIMSGKLRLEALVSKLSNISPAGDPNQYDVVADTNGIVMHIEAAAGQSVGANKPLIRLFKGQQYWASTQLPERLAGLIKLGDEVSVLSTQSAARVVAIDPEIDSESRSIEMIIELPSESTWQIGQLIDLAFSSAVDLESLTIPSKAIVRLDGATFVFVENNQSFETVPIEVIARGRDQAVVKSTLSDGSAIAISGLAALKNMVEGG